MGRALSKYVYEYLIGKILRNELVAGEMINRRQIAGELGVSVAPVLEAMLQLESEGFIETIPRKGTRVTLIRDSDIRGYLVIREALECQAARFYCGKPVQENEEWLLQLAKEVDRTELGSVESWKAEISFHKALVDLAGYDVLTAEFERAMKLNLFYSMNKLLTTDDTQEREQHVLLLQSLKTADPDTAEAIIRRHLRSGKGRLINSKMR